MEILLYRGKNSVLFVCSIMEFLGYGYLCYIFYERVFFMVGLFMMLFVFYCDVVSKDSGFIGFDKKSKDKDEIIIIYFLWGELILYRTIFFGRCVILGYFKILLFLRKGSYR